MNQPVTSSHYKYAAYFVLYEVSVYLANDMIMPGMVNVVHEFAVPVSYAATSLSVFILGGCSLPFILSLVAAQVGYRHVLLWGNLLFVAACLVTPLAQNINQFLFARFMQGMGLGFIFIGYATVHGLFDDVAAIKLTALLGNISSLAPLVGPLLGGLITNQVNWRWIFILLAGLSFLAWRGLKHYMPAEIPGLGRYGNRQVLSQYRDLLTSRVFAYGTIVNSCNGIIMISWIGLSPVIILDSYRQPFANYALYQLLVFTGSVLSSGLLQVVATPGRLASLIKYGRWLALLGLLASLGFSFVNYLLCIGGLFLYTLGSGLYTGVINRLVIASWPNYSSPITALNSIIYALVSVAGLEVYNYICSALGYVLPTLALLNLLIGLVVSSIAPKFCQIHAHLTDQAPTNNLPI